MRLLKHQRRTARGTSACKPFLLALALSIPAPFALTPQPVDAAWSYIAAGEPVTLAKSSVVTTADVLGTGRAQLIVGSGNELKLIRLKTAGNGGGLAPDRARRLGGDQPVAPVSSILAVDLDGDGWDELAVGTSGAGSLSLFEVVRWSPAAEGEGESAEERGDVLRLDSLAQLGYMWETIVALEAADVTGDGFIDLLAVTGSGEMTLYTYDMERGPHVFQFGRAWAGQPLDDRSWGGMTAIDWDGDGDAELALSSTDDYVGIYDWTGSGWKAVWENYPWGRLMYTAAWPPVAPEARSPQEAAAAALARARAKANAIKASPTAGGMREAAGENGSVPKTIPMGDPSNLLVVTSQRVLYNFGWESGAFGLAFNTHDPLLVGSTFLSITAPPPAATIGGAAEQPDAPRLMVAGRAGLISFRVSGSALVLESNAGFLTDVRELFNLSGGHLAVLTEADELWVLEPVPQDYLEIRVNDRNSELWRSPLILEETLYIDVIDIAQLLGDVDWEWKQETGTLVIRRADNRVALRAGQMTANWNDVMEVMPAPLRVVRERPYVPVDVIAYLDASVKWDAPYRRLTIHKESLWDWLNWR